MSPVPDAIIITMNTTTITSDTIPTWSDFRRFHASAHRPGETVCGISRGRRAELGSVASFAIGVPVT